MTEPNKELTPEALYNEILEYLEINSKRGS